VEAQRFTFQVEVNWDGSTGGEVKFAKHPSLRFDIPESFGGRGAGYCPEELFLASIAACLVNTFAYLRPKLRLKAKSLRVEALDYVMFKDGGYRVSEVRLKVKIEVEKGQAELARRCLGLAEEYCHITRSIKPCIPVYVEVEVLETAI